MSQDASNVGEAYLSEDGGFDGVAEVSKSKKLFESVQNNPLDVRFEDACMTAMSLGFEKKGGKGSHVVFGRNDTKDILNFQNRNGRIPAYQARQLIKMIEKFGSES